MAESVGAGREAGGRARGGGRSRHFPRKWQFGVSVRQNDRMCIFPRPRRAAGPFADSGQALRSGCTRYLRSSSPPMVLAAGGIPTSSVLVIDGRIVGRGHNQRVQRSSATLHAEMDCLENADRQNPRG